MLLWVFFVTVNRSRLVWFFFFFCVFCFRYRDTRIRDGFTMPGIEDSGSQFVADRGRFEEGSRKLAFYSFCRSGCWFIVIAKEYRFPKGGVE